MNLKQLKQGIIDATLNIDFIIFKCDDIDFLPMQYVHEIRNLFHANIEFIEDISQISLHTADIFYQKDTNDTQNLRVYCCDVFDSCSMELMDQKNFIVICKKIDKNSEFIYQDCIVNFPKMEQWYINDFVYTVCEGVEKELLDKFISVCNNDIYRIQQELKKLRSFSNQEIQSIFKQFLLSITDMSEYKIFDFTNAILKKDVGTVSKIYQEIESIDIDPLGLVTLLTNGFKNVIKVQLANNPSPESCGMWILY